MNIPIEKLAKALHTINKKAKRHRDTIRAIEDRWYGYDFDMYNHTRANEAKNNCYNIKEQVIDKLNIPPIGKHILATKTYRSDEHYDAEDDEYYYDYECKCLVGEYYEFGGFSFHRNLEWVYGCGDEVMDEDDDIIGEIYEEISATSNRIYKSDQYAMNILKQFLNN
jgi:hypothetical protein